MRAELAVDDEARPGDDSVTPGPPARADHAAWVGLLAATSSLGLLGWWVLRSPFVGLADNGDWGRYSCPLGLSGQVRFNRLPATLAPQDCLAFDYRSTFTPFLWVFAKVDTWATGAVHVSHLAMFWSVVLSVAWGWFGFELCRATRRPTSSLITVVLLILVSSDITFTSYLGSIYAEALIISLLPALAAALLRLVRCDRPTAPTLVGTVALLVAITGAKPSMALTAPLFVGVVLVARWGSLDRVRAATAAVGAIGLALFSLIAIADPVLTSWNTYNLAFTVVLPESDDPHSVLVDMGIEPADARELERFVGVYFGPTVSKAWEDPPLVAFREAGRPAVLRALAVEPSSWGHLVQRGGMSLGDLRLDYLANHTGSAEADTPALADRPAPADIVLDPLANAWWALPLSWVVLAGWFGRQLTSRERTDAGRAAVRALGLFAVAFAASQTLIALGDGDYELAKHLVVAGEATALTATGLVLAGLGVLHDRVRARA